MNFQYTGKNIPLRLDKCINFVSLKLQEYDYALENGKKIGDSPYHNKIVMSTEDGKFVEIPTEIQNEAVKLWLAQKEMGSNHKNDSVNNTHAFEPDDNDNDDDENKKNNSC